MQLAVLMTIIVNKSINEGIVPLIYKKARIFLLYKKGSVNDCGNYRPVSLLHSLSKNLEKAVCRQLMVYMETYQLLCKDQFGFRKISQTSHVVQSMLNTIHKNSANNEVTIATYTDLSKAFDCLQYKQLFTKMTALGFTKRTLNWFKSYLSKRVQYTEINGKLSQHLDVDLGVPQGSISSPVFFLNLYK